MFQIKLSTNYVFTAIKYDKKLYFSLEINIVIHDNKP